MATSSRSSTAHQQECISATPVGRGAGPTSDAWCIGQPLSSRLRRPGSGRQWAPLFLTFVSDQGGLWTRPMRLKPSGVAGPRAMRVRAWSGEGPVS